VGDPALRGAAQLPGVRHLGMSAPWNLDVLREHIRRQGAETDFLLEVADSLGRSVNIFRYHLFTARDALKGIVDERHSVDKALDVVFGEQQEAYRYAKLVSEAHMFGCFHVARSMFDMFAQLVNGLVLNSSLSVRDCDIWRVHKPLAASDLKAEIGQLLESAWFDYVSDVVNTIKHRRLVQHSFTISFDDNVAGIRIGAFQYGDRSHPPYWANEVLEGILEVKNRIVGCGRTLNAHCANALRQ
jgi:hypothetical protein